MTNADDICAELAAARAYITRGDYTAALEAIDQAVKVWAAERDYWALVEVEAGGAERFEIDALKAQQADEAYEEATRTAHKGLVRDIATIMGAPRDAEADAQLRDDMDAITEAEKPRIVTLMERLEESVRLAKEARHATGEEGWVLTSEGLGDAGIPATEPTAMVSEQRPSEPTTPFPKPREMPVSWGYRHETGMMDDGDWRSHGIA